MPAEFDRVRRGLKISKRPASAYDSGQFQSPSASSVELKLRNGTFRARCICEFSDLSVCFLTIF